MLEEEAEVRGGVEDSSCRIFTLFGVYNATQRNATQYNDIERHHTHKST
jgi:hypothetical protein